MSPEDWDRTQRAFEDLSGLDCSAQQARLEALRHHDPALAQTVANLLQADAGSSVLDASLTDMAEAALRDDPVGTLIQTEIGPYRLVRLLGEGGMGVVYLAERLHIGGCVAIKLLRDAWMSPMRRDRFRLEQQTLARLNHPNIAQIHDAGHLHGDTPWFVMEYVDGLPLTDWAKVHAATLPQVLTLIRQVAEAVAYAHRHALVHRDLKPSNVLVTSAGEVKLLDFGIVKDLSGNATDHTLEGLRPLTPGYAAPEQRSGAPVGLFTDIYGLGVLLYELLTGCIPLLDAEGYASRPSRSNALIPHRRRILVTRSQWADLDAICLRALHPDPARRYSSADALLQDLDAFEKGQVLTARPPHRLYTMAKFARRNRLVLGITAAAVLLLAATAIVAAVRVTRSRDLALRQLSRMARLQRFTEDLFDGGTHSDGRSAELTTAMLLQRGEIQAEGMHDDLELQASMFATLGGTWQHLGDLPRAEGLLRRALDERDPANPANNLASRALFAESLTDFGLLRLDQRRMDEAESLLRRAIALAPDAKVVDEQTERAMCALGDVLATRGKYPESRSVLEDMVAAEMRSKRPDSQQLGDCLSRLADVHFYLGNYARATELDKKALSVYRRTVGDGHPAMAHVTNTLGDVALDQGHFPEAEASFRKGLALDERWYGPENSVVAEDLTSISRVLSRTGHQEEARTTLLRALAIQEHTHGRTHSAVANILNNLGTLAYNRDLDDEAEGDFRKALSIWRTVYGEHHQFVALSYSNLAGVYIDRKEYAKAEDMARHSLAVYLQTLPPNHPSIATIHVKLGRILLREGKFAEAEPETHLGYDYFRTHGTSEPTYLAGSRKDLIAIATALHNTGLMQQLTVDSQH